ncbi:hypothetical protein DRW07_16340 [Alteromonas sediminis]|uniref:Uncharacterized protein n=1 Tax=Alteromonas sediminis TaxID=2259342 RepID=A0A3N5Z5A6_9ALTE|nr:hypothetical protein [Alteromonas sediminis]RPJ65464.1 hypothetical protein DRW07_16340 [Alteromonas sediminis]
MMFAFGVIAVLTLLLIYFVIKNQQANTEIRELKSIARRTNRQLAVVSGSTTMLTAGMQVTLQKRLQAAHKRGFVSEGDAKVLNHLFIEFENVIKACFQKGQTVEEALSELLAGEDVSLEDVKAVVKKYPKEVRLAWSKNTAEGFILSMTKMSELFTPQTNSGKEAEKPEVSETN